MCFAASKRKPSMPQLDELVEVRLVGLLDRGLRPVEVRERAQPAVELGRAVAVRVLDAAARVEAGVVDPGKVEAVELRQVRHVVEDHVGHDLDAAEVGRRDEASQVGLRALALDDGVVHRLVPGPPLPARVRPLRGRDLDVGVALGGQLADEFLDVREGLVEGVEDGERRLGPSSRGGRSDEEQDEGGDERQRCRAANAAVHEPPGRIGVDCR